MPLKSTMNLFVACLMPTSLFSLPFWHFLNENSLNGQTSKLGIYWAINKGNMLRTPSLFGLGTGPCHLLLSFQIIGRLIFFIPSLTTRLIQKICVKFHFFCCSSLYQHKVFKNDLNLTMFVQMFLNRKKFFFTTFKYCVVRFSTSMYTTTKVSTSKYQNRLFFTLLRFPRRFFLFFSTQL